MDRHFGRPTKMRLRQRIEKYVLYLLVFFIVTVTVTRIILRRIEPSLSEKCSPDFPLFSVNISDAKEISGGGYESEDHMKYTKGAFYDSNGSRFGCPCSVKSCTRKCCGPSEEFVLINNELECVTTNYTFNILSHSVFGDQGIIKENNYEKPIFVNDLHFYIFNGIPCKNIYQKIETIIDNKHFLLKDGKIITTDSEFPYKDQSQYCLETFASKDNSENFVKYINTFECYQEDEDRNTEPWIDYVKLMGYLVSIPCLIATLVVYALLSRKEQNLHGYCLMSHVSCLIIGFSTLVYVHYEHRSTETKGLSCKISGFVILFSFLASFSWLNVMCFDIWRKFNDIMVGIVLPKEEELRKFPLYSLYAWGVPVAIITVTACAEFTPWVSVLVVKPLFGSNSCWFHKKDAQILYFYLPVGVMITVNLVMFWSTFSILYSSKKDSEKLNNADSRRHNVSEQHRVYLYLKLFIVMGVSWVMEVVAFAIGGSEVNWILSDLVNSLQGLFIFIIFVCKRRILKKLKKRLGPVTIFGRTMSYRSDSSRTNSSRISNDNTTQLNRISYSSS